MAYKIADWTAKLSTLAMIHRTYAGLATEAAAVATALGSDTTTHDKTIELPPTALQQSPTNSKFLNELLSLVNTGKAGNLSAATMGTTITSTLTSIIPPVNTVAPVASGTAAVGSTLSVTNGTWSFTPTSFQYRWFRGAAPIMTPGGNASTYLLVAADSGQSISCRVRGYNAQGETSAQSNAIAVA